MQSTDRPQRWRRPPAYLCHFMVLILSLTAVGCAHRAAPLTWVDWPRYGAAQPGLDLHGHTNALPDFVGPIDGSARLTIFTEGNHFPVLLPLALQAFPAWSDQHCGLAVAPQDLLIVTLPQVMVVEALLSGNIALGNALLPLQPGRVYPDLVMGGDRPLSRLASQGLIEPTAVVFARHRGMGLLLRRDRAGELSSLADLPAAPLSVVVATPNEAGARRQYRQTLEQLLGAAAVERIFAREIQTFPGRLKIQHRDVPYALLTGQAEVGLLFGHLADFYARAFPAQLQFVPVEEAAPFGQTINLARSRGNSEPLARCFEDFLLATARSYYPQRGFAAADTFGYGQRLQLLDAGG